MCCTFHSHGGSDEIANGDSKLFEGIWRATGILDDTYHCTEISMGGFKIHNDSNVVGITITLCRNRALSTGYSEPK